MKLKFCKTLFFLLLFSLFNGQLAFAQDINPGTDHDGTSKFQLGLMFSPEVCNRVLTDNNTFLHSDKFIAMRNDRETFKIGYTTGFALLYNVNSKLAIVTGLQYSNQGYQYKQLDFRAIDPDPSIPSKTSTRHNFHYLDIPLKGNVIFGKGKIRFISSMGITTSFLLNETTINKLTYPNGSKKRNKSSFLQYHNRISLSPNLGAGLDIQLNNVSNLRLEPTIRYGVLPVNDSPVTTNLWSAGLSLGYFYRL